MQNNYPAAYPLEAGYSAPANYGAPVPGPYYPGMEYAGQQPMQPGQMTSAPAPSYAPSFNPKQDPEMAEAAGGEGGDFNGDVTKGYSEDLKEGTYDDVEEVAPKKFGPFTIMGWIGIVCLLAYVGYLVASMVHDFDRALPLVLFSIFVAVCYLFKYVTPFLTPLANAYKKFKTWIVIAFGVVILALSLWVVVLVAMEESRRLIAFTGLAFNVVVAIALSSNKRSINWYPVAMGLILQTAIGLFVLRTQVGSDAFQAASDAINKANHYAGIGAGFLFNDAYISKPLVTGWAEAGIPGPGGAPMGWRTTLLLTTFAFGVLPAIIFFSAIIAVFYHFGIMQAVIRAIARTLSEFMGISALECIVAGANIFLGSNTSPLLVKPLLADCSRSELFSIMVSGFATIAGNLFGAFGSMGIDTKHLVSASVISAPAALAIAKIMEPEMAKSTDVRNWHPKSEDRNWVEAVSRGALEALPICANIAALLIVAIGGVAMLNDALTWLGVGVGMTTPLTLELIFSYLFWPFAFTMGIDTDDCKKIAELLGVKTFVNEFVAFLGLAALCPGDDPANWEISLTSKTIATYALCGFSNVGSVGMCIGCLGFLAPTRSGEIASMAFKAMFGGFLACCMTACVAALFFDPTM